MTTQSLESMRSPARLKLSKVETEIFQERLKYMTPRQVDLNFEELIEKFKEHKKIYDEKLAVEKKEEEKRYGGLYWLKLSRLIWTLMQRR